MRQAKESNMKVLDERELEIIYNALQDLHIKVGEQGQGSSEYAKELRDLMVKISEAMVD